MTRPAPPVAGGRVVVVTGASDGVGEAAALALARTGAQVVVVGRSPAKTRAVAASVGAAAGSPVPHHTVDFADLGQVRALAAELVATHERIDVLVDNAGLIAGQRTVTGDGHELTMQVNHLGPYLLTRLLRDPLVAAGGRVIVTASAAGRGRYSTSTTWRTRRTTPRFAPTPGANWPTSCSPGSWPAGGDPTE